MIKKSILAVLLLSLAFSAAAFRPDTVKVWSATMDKDVPAIILVPDAALSERGPACPTVYLLHGHSGDYKFWPSIRKDLGQVADAYGFIFVCPDAGNSWYFDSPVKKDSQYETFCSRELVEWVDAHYRTRPERNFRAISGLSMGGHGALFLAMRHPDVFGSAGSMSGCPDIRVHPNNWGISEVLGNYADRSSVWDEHSVVCQIPRIKDGDLALIIDCGEEDFMLPLNQDLHVRLLGAGIGHDFITRPGTHWFTYWQNAVDYQLLFHSKFFRSHDQ